MSMIQFYHLVSKLEVIKYIPQILALYMCDQINNIFYCVRAHEISPPSMLTIKN